MDDTSSRNTSKNNKNIIYIFLVLFAAFIVILTIVKLSHSVKSTSSTNQTDNGQNAKATQNLNKSYNFPIRDDNGKEVGKLTYEIQTAELRDQILIKGQPATAAKDRTFLILNLKITNKTDKNINMNTRDYVRLTVDNGQEYLAPEVHNDPVEIQAISTKHTRLGFPIFNKDIKNAQIQIGEIKGTKDKIKLNF